MSNLRRPLVLGLSTCALLLMSSRVAKKNQAAAAREGTDLEPDSENDSAPLAAEKASAQLRIEPAHWTD
ncbi:MAG: hypothetical protein KGN79_08025 [Acidobacteriota bacterium]|nr:hypothetical protein [Acidobacteriota bacterium]